MNNDARNIYGLTERDMNTLYSIFRSFPEVKTVHLFGSRAKGNYNLGSDVDMAIMNHGVNSLIRAKIKNRFEESSLPYNIDLVDFNTLTKEEFIEHIQRVGVPIYKRGKEFSTKHKN